MVIDIGMALPYLMQLLGLLQRNIYNYYYSYVCSDLASRNRDRRIMTASQVLCLSCSSIAVNFFRMIATIRSISFGAIGRVRLCSWRRFTTWPVNSLQAYNRISSKNLHKAVSLLHKAATLLAITLGNGNSKQCPLKVPFIRTTLEL